MNHQQYGFANPADHMPTLLAIDHAIFAEDEIRVSENPRCRKAKLSDGLAHRQPIQFGGPKRASTIGRTGAGKTRVGR